MSIDGPSRGLYKDDDKGPKDDDKEVTDDDKEPKVEPGQRRYLAGSRALESLESLITSTETYFHPSNAGMWTMSLTTFLHRVTAEFSKRWKEEEQPTCKTPVVRTLLVSYRCGLTSV